MRVFLKKLQLNLLCAIMMFAAMSMTAYADSYERHAITVNGSVNSRSYGADAYFGKTPQMTSFWDQNNKYHVAYLYRSSDSQDASCIYIQRYNESLELEKTVKIAAELPLFGNLTTDGNYYYVVWGLENAGTEDQVATCTAKYTMDGTKVSCCEITGYESNPPYNDGSYWGTKIPFRAGNCALAIQGDILVCTYAREMFSGHQSNYVFYVNKNTMQRVNYSAIPYCSHSFNQDVIPTFDGGYLFADHGDASKRSFVVVKVRADGTRAGEMQIFHFREGGEGRAYGYNETYAEMGGLVETTAGYMFCGSSEKTLSLAPAPTGGVYMKPNEARNLFVQVLKKDFWEYTDANAFVNPGVTRPATGTRPDTSVTSLYLPAGGVTDYGVVWLTDYPDDFYVNNPKIIGMADGNVMVLWEKISYSTKKGGMCYMILDASGNVVAPEATLPGVYMPGASKIAYHKEKIYWTTADENGKKIHVLDPNISAGEKTAEVVQYGVTLDGSVNLNCYLRLSLSLVMDTSTRFIVQSESGTKEYTATEMNRDDINDLYYITIPVSAPHMADDITITVKDSDATYLNTKYSVKKYGEYLLEHAGENAEFTKAAPVVRAMLNYGAYAQLYFGVNTSNRADSNVYTASTDPVKIKNPTFPYCFEIFEPTDGVVGLEYAGASIVCDNKIGLNVYFSIKANYETIKTQLDGKSQYTPIRHGDSWDTLYGTFHVRGDYLILEIDNISAGLLSEYVYSNVSVPGESGKSIAFWYTLDTYLKKAVNGSDTALANLAEALLYYSDACKAYME